MVLIVETNKKECKDQIFLRIFLISGSINFVTFKFYNKHNSFFIYAYIFRIIPYFFFIRQSISFTNQNHFLCICICVNLFKISLLLKRGIDCWKEFCCLLSFSLLVANLKSSHLFTIRIFLLLPSLSLFKIV